MAATYRYEFDAASGAELTLLDLVSSLELFSTPRGHARPSKTKLRDQKRNSLPYDWGYLGIRHGTTTQTLQLVTVCTPSDALEHRRIAESRSVACRRDLIVQFGRCIIERNGDQRGVVFYDRVWLSSPLRQTELFVVHRPRWARLALRFDEGARSATAPELQRRWQMLCDVVMLMVADCIEENWLWHPWTRRTRVLVVPSTGVDALPIVLPPLLDRVDPAWTPEERRSRLASVLYSVLETVPAGLKWDTRAVWQDQLAPLRTLLGDPTISLTRSAVTALLPATCTPAKHSCAPLSAPSIPRKTPTAL